VAILAKILKKKSISLRHQKQYWFLWY